MSCSSNPRSPCHDPSHLRTSTHSSGFYSSSSRHSLENTSQSPQALTLTCHKHCSHVAAALEAGPSVLETRQLSLDPLRLDF